MVRQMLAEGGAAGVVLVEDDHVGVRRRGAEDHGEGRCRAFDLGGGRRYLFEELQQLLALALAGNHSADEHDTAQGFLLVLVHARGSQHAW